MGNYSKCCKGLEYPKMPFLHAEDCPLRASGRFIPYREDLAERQQFDQMTNSMFNGQPLLQIACTFDTMGRQHVRPDGTSGSFSQHCFISINELHAALDRITALEEENKRLKELLSMFELPQDFVDHARELTKDMVVDLDHKIEGPVSLDEEEDDISPSQQIENALDEASGTQRTPGTRFIKVMAALGFNFGDPEDIDETYAKFYKEQEQYRKYTLQKLFVVFGGELIDLSGSPEFRDPKNIHVAGIFDDEKVARDVWKGNAQRTVDNALMRYFVVPLAEALNSIALANQSRK